MLNPASCINALVGRYKRARVREAMVAVDAISDANMPFSIGNKLNHIIKAQHLNFFRKFVSNI